MGKNIFTFLFHGLLLQSCMPTADTGTFDRRKYFFEECFNDSSTMGSLEAGSSFANLFFQFGTLRGDLLNDSTA